MVSGLMIWGRGVSANVAVLQARAMLNLYGMSVGVPRRRSIGSGGLRSAPCKEFSA